MPVQGIRNLFFLFTFNIISFFYIHYKQIVLNFFQHVDKAEVGFAPSVHANA